MNIITLGVKNPEVPLAYLEPFIRENYVKMYGDADEAGDIDASIFQAGRGGLTIALVDGAIAGCAGWTWLSNCGYTDDLIPESWPTATVELKRLFVLPQFRGIGVAQALVDARFEEIWKTEALLAVGETGGEQSISKHLHLKAGWVEVEPFGYWKDNPESTFFGKWRSKK